MWRLLAAPRLAPSGKHAPEKPLLFLLSALLNQTQPFSGQGIAGVELEGFVVFGFGQGGLLPFEEDPALECEAFGMPTECEGLVEHLACLLAHGPAVMVFGVFVNRPCQVGQNNAVGLVTGDAVAQVSSQTLSNLNVVDRASDEVVLRPLVSMDKESIIRSAREIGTETFARNMPEYCGVMSERPTTQARKSRTERDEAFLDDSVLDSAVANRTMTPVDQILESEVGVDDVPRVNTPSQGDVIIDIRHPGEAADAPLTLTNNEIRPIPFYELNQRFAALDSSNRYLLYCDEGSMSTLHVGHLMAEGDPNVVVYDPQD